MADMRTLGQRLRHLRKRKSITQAEAAAAADVARSTYSGYELGIDTPGREALIKLADLFDASLDWIEGRLHKVNMPEIGHFVNDADELAILSLWAGMDDETRTHLMGLMKRSPPQRRDVA